MNAYLPNPAGFHCMKRLHELHAHITLSKLYRIQCEGMVHVLVDTNCGPYEVLCTPNCTLEDAYAGLTPTGDTIKYKSKYNPDA